MPEAYTIKPKKNWLNQPFFAHVHGPLHSSGLFLASAYQKQWPLRSKEKKLPQSFTPGAMREQSSGAKSNSSDESYGEKAKASDIPSENHTVLLLNNVLRHILHNAQPLDGVGALEHREPKRISHNTTSSAVTAEDDGRKRKKSGRKQRILCLSELYVRPRARRKRRLVRALES
ncbi:hypothetical protein NXS19_012964 [Fusarium pseudograminearum]|nr:hypothetical protein NXS19_012964 [Fusarium pseudograminearum]